MNLSRLRKAMDESGLDAVIAASPENVLYAAGTCELLVRLQLDRTRLVMAIFDKVSDPTLLVAATALPKSKQESRIQDIRTFSIDKSPISPLVEILREKGLANAKVGIDFDYLPVSFFQELTSLMPKATFVDSSKLFRNLRMVAEEKEIEILRYAAMATRKAIDATFLLIRPGDTEKHLSDMIVRHMLMHGCDKLLWTMAGSGLGHLLHQWPRVEHRLTQGELVHIDCGGEFQGYFSDVARTAVVGKPSDRQRRIYEAVVRTEKEVIKNLRVGVRASDLFNIGKAVFEEAGLPYFLFYIGHGLGTELHGPPLLRADNEQTLQEGMVLNIEPITIHPEEGIVHVEDTVLVTSSGPEILTGETASEEMFVIE